MTHPLGELAFDPFHGGRAGFDQQLAVAVAADIEAQEIVPGLQRHDAGLVEVEGQAPGCQPRRQLGLDMLCLLPGMAADHEVVAVTHQHRAARGGAHPVGAVPHPDRGLHPMQRDVQQQRADHATLWTALFGGREPLPRLEHSRLQPCQNHSPGL